MTNKSLELGEKRYFKFVENILGHKKVMTPRTHTLEIFGMMIADDELKYFMLRELSCNFDQDYDMIVSKGTLFRVYKVDKMQKYDR